MEDPLQGEQKKGDLAFLRVYKFNMVKYQSKRFSAFVFKNNPSHHPYSAKFSGKRNLIFISNRLKNFIKPVFEVNRVTERLQRQPLIFDFPPQNFN